MTTPYSSSYSTRRAIAKMDREGKSIRQMMEILRLDKSTIMYHRRNMKLVQKQTTMQIRMEDDQLINTANRWLTRHWR